MEEKPLSPRLEDEVEQLRSEVRRLREEQERLKQSGNGRGDIRWNKDKERDDNDDSLEEGGNKHSGRNAKGGNDEDEDQDKSDSQEKESDEEKAAKKRRRRPFIIVGVIAVLFAGLLWWLHARQFEDTDDATVDGHISGISSRISGIVVAVYVDQNDFVKAGEDVVDLDPRDYQVSLDQARGALSQARGQLLMERPNVPSTIVTSQTNVTVAHSEVIAAENAVAAAERNYQAALQKLREAEANNAKAQTDVERYRPLSEKDEVPREQFDQVRANAKALAATVAANQETAHALLKQVAQAKEQLAQAQQRATETTENAPRQVAIQKASLTSREAGLQSAEAQWEQASLNLSYCKITTPVNGIVAKRIVEVGQHVTPGQQLLLVTQTDNLWVTANFRETQIKHMHAGQSVRIHVDALGDNFDGYVENLPAASGAVISLLPPENATGNFVKIVQRLPVRIRFKQGQTGLFRLRPGMSAEPKVRVR